VAAAILLLRPEVFSAAILLRAMVPLEPPSPPDLTQARVLISFGERDAIVARENVQRLAAMLREAGANVTLHFEPAGHALAVGDIEAAKGWLRDL
jgi:phospholipase/carboxylesterase